VKIRKAVQRVLRRVGYDVRWTPAALAAHPEARLEPSLAAAIARRYLAVRDFRYVQVGAFDGVCVDPLAGVVDGLEARALLIEPQPEAFARLAQNTAHRRGVELLQAAVSDEEGELPFYSLDPRAPGAPSKAMLISSLDRAMLLRELDPKVDWSPWIRTARVRCATLNTLLAERGIARLDLLQVDAEGYDGRILRALDFSRWKPGIINFEHVLMPAAEAEACWRLLVAQGYRLHVSPPDTLAVLRDS
jgi:FkbM family methyltransferase